MAERTYEIGVAGRLSIAATDAFEPHAVRFVDGASVIHAGNLDQAALFGVLLRTQSLGLELLEVRIGVSESPRRSRLPPPP